MDSNSLINIIKPTLLVLSGPSGSGKTTIRKILDDKIDKLSFSLSATTRDMRTHEIDGKDYYFLNKEKFEEMIDNKEFIEFEEVHDNYYGTPLKSVEKAIEDTCLMLFDIDVYGGLRIKKYYPDAILIYVKVENKDDLRQRLISRGTDSIEDIDKRLSRMSIEDEYSEKYDHVILNNRLDETIDNITDIITKYQNNK